MEWPCLPPAPPLIIWDRVSPRALPFKTHRSCNMKRALVLKLRPPLHQPRRPWPRHFWSEKGPKKPHLFTPQQIIETTTHDLWWRKNHTVNSPLEKPRLFLCDQLPTYICMCACLYMATAMQIYFMLSVAGHIISIFNTTTKSLSLWFGMAAQIPCPTWTMRGDNINMTTQCFLFAWLNN